jgi:hypothetical protein
VEMGGVEGRWEGRVGGGGGREWTRGGASCGLVGVVSCKVNAREEMEGHGRWGRVEGWGEGLRMDVRGLRPGVIYRVCVVGVSVEGVRGKPSLPFAVRSRAGVWNGYGTHSRTHTSTHTHTHTHTRARTHTHVYPMRQEHCNNTWALQQDKGTLLDPRTMSATLEEQLLE